jgi:hypothetical protein
MMRLSNRGVRVCGLLAACAGIAAFGYLAAEENADTTKFLGAAKCKYCHQSTRSGNQFAKWEKMEHANAYATLGKDAAREVARKLGIEDPQKSDKCLRCHVTAHGVPESRLSVKFDPAMGIQCESCHGPGYNHFKARLAAAGKDDVYDISEHPYVKIPPGEIDTEPTFLTCVKCHNADCPSFKPLCSENISKEILHFFRRTPSDEEITALKKKITSTLEERNASCGGPAKCERCRKAAKP